MFRTLESGAIPQNTSCLYSWSETTLTEEALLSVFLVELSETVCTRNNPGTFRNTVNSVWSHRGTCFRLLSLICEISKWRKSFTDTLLTLEMWEMSHILLVFFYCVQENESLHIFSEHKISFTQFHRALFSFLAGELFIPYRMANYWTQKEHQ